MIALLKGSEFEAELCLLRGTKWLDEQQAHCPVYHADIERWIHPSGMRGLLRLRRHMRQRGYAIVQTFFVESNLLGPFLARSAGVKAVVGSRRNSNYWMSAGYAFAQRIANHLVTRLQANCEAVKRVVARQESISPAKIDVLYNSLDVERFRRSDRDRAAVRARLQLAEADVVITNVSALRPPKGTGLFVRAAIRALRQEPALHFVLAGDGPLRKELEEAVVRAEAGARIHLVGAQREVPPWLSASDVAVLSSESEGLSNSILEYMAAGLPVIATEVGGNAEALGDTGVLIPSGDETQLAQAMLRLAKDADLRRRLGEAARRRAEAVFAVPRMQEALLHYYRGLLPMSPKAPVPERG